MFLFLLLTGFVFLCCFVLFCFVIFCSGFLVVIFSGFLVVIFSAFVRPLMVRFDLFLE